APLADRRRPADGRRRNHSGRGRRGLIDLQKGTLMRRGLLLLSTVAVCLAFAPAASASKPIREINPHQGDVVIAHQCAFPVLGRIDGPEIIKTWTDDAGDPTKQIVTFPGNKLTFTNLVSGTSVTVAG